MKFSIHQHSLEKDLEDRLLDTHRESLNWPLVYFLEKTTFQSGEKGDAYVGETTDVLNRLKTHTKTDKKKSLDTVRLITSELFNKSATLDLESNLIRYISADGKYTLQNGNLGLSNHQFYQKQLYWGIFKDIWDELRKLGVARHSLDHIDNSDLFKYSPYKSLSREQVNGLKTILDCLLDDKANVSLVKGGAGTGKSILAIFLFKLLKTDLNDFNFADFDEEDEYLYKALKLVKDKYGHLRMALVIPMSSFRRTVANVFKNIKGLTRHMVIGPSDMNKQDYDLIIIDEGHRLRRRTNLTNYKSFDDALKKANLNPLIHDEIDLLNTTGAKSVIFYDDAQSVKPTDIPKQKFQQLASLQSTRVEKLQTQFRVKGGNEYVRFIADLLNAQVTETKLHDFKQYELMLFEQFEDFVEVVKRKDQVEGLSRFVAGYAWEHKSKKDPKAIDIIIDNFEFQWNRTSIDWVNSPTAINEIGCIHTTQGYDLNYAGIIIGPELDYDFESGQFVVYKDRYKDKNGKNNIKDTDTLKSYILNIYKTILLRGIRGTYLYVCNENLRQYFQQFIPTYIKNNTVKAVTFFDEPGKHRIPYYDLAVAAGSFSEKQMVGEAKYIELPEINDEENYFACKVVGESMNKVIPNNSICLFKKYNGGSRNGLITVVEGTDIYDSETGNNYTVKEYQSRKSIDEDGWKHEEIILKPLSTDAFDPIVLRDEQTMNFTVVGVFEKVLETPLNGK